MNNYHIGEKVYPNNKKRLLKIMRISLFFLLSCIMVSQASNSFSQSQKLSLNLNHKTIEEVCEAIEQNSRYSFVFSGNTSNAINKKVNVQVDDKTIDEILDQIFASTNLGYRIIDEQVVVHEKGPSAKITDPKVTKSEQLPNRLILSGTVTDNEGESLPGANIYLKSNQSIGTVTDIDGKYLITVPNEADVLVFTFIGMKNQEIKVTPGMALLLNVIMKPQDTELGEVVITGIFNKSKESYTGAVTSISQQELKTFKGQNMLQTLRNIDPAINIVQNNMSGSNPNFMADITIRGNSSLPMSVQELNQDVGAQLNFPLIIMDGFEIRIQQLMDLSDDQVESINILKDAAATAIYGSRGANGVIVIVTKRPELGEIKVSFRAGANIEVPDLSSYNLMTALEKIDFDYKMGLYSSIHPSEDLRLREAYYNVRRDVLGGVDTYWLSQPLRTGIGQAYNLKLEGGVEEFRWSVEGNYNETIGVMKGSKRNVFNGAVNLNYQRNKLLFVNRTMFNTSRGDESKFGTFSEYTKMNPYWKVRDENGRYVESFYHSPTDRYVFNPLYDSQFNNKDYKRDNTITNNFSLDWRPIVDFSVRGNIGISKTFSNSDKFVSPHSSKFKNTSVILERGSYDFTTGESLSLNANVTASYTKRIADAHQIYGGVDFSVGHMERYSYAFSMLGYNDRFDFLPNAAGYTENGKPNGAESKTRRVGLTSNVNYSYLNRYSIDGSFNLDGSSQFGTDKKFAPFWSVGAGWNLHNEEFINKEVFSQLQLRGSYGVTGSQNFPSYQGLTKYKYDVNDRYLFDTPAYLMGYGNKNLTWQWTNMINLGLNFGFFDRRLTGSLDVYRNDSKNLLSTRTLAASTGFQTFADNIGSTRNSGIEMMLSGFPIRNANGFTWMLTGKAARNINKIIELSEEIKAQTEQYLQSNVEMPVLMYEGASSTAIYAVKSLGIDPSTGQELFYDKDGNITYVWNANAKTLVGDSEPKFRGSMSSLLRYKNLSLNLSFGFHFGGQQYNSTLINRVEVPRSALNNNVDRRVLDERWFEPGQITFYKSFYDLEGNPAGTTKASSRFIQDDNMFSLQSASLNYIFENDWLKRNLGAKIMEASVNVSDLLYFSTIKRERGLNYPFSRQIFFSLRMTF